ncbi:MAG: UbiX family flavin prenyltransferase, partial [Methanobacteriota archaeon]
MKIIVGMTGGSGAQYGLRLIETLLQLGHEPEIVVSPAAKRVLELEVGPSYENVLNQVQIQYDVNDIAAPIASGSHQNEGMVIAPCSMKTIAAISTGYTQNLIHRAADCMLKEGRKLVLLFRETPLNLIHLRNLTQLKEAGAVIMPAAPGFYYHPKTVDDLVDFIVAKILGQFGLKHPRFKPWDP